MNDTDRKIKSWKRVIVFRSARLDKISRILSSPQLKELSPDEILVIAQRGVERKELEKVFGDCRVEYILPGSFGLSKISLSTFRKLKSFRADAFIVPYNNPAKRGYRPIEMLGLLLNGPDVVGIDGEGKVREVSAGAFFARVKDGIIRKAAPLMHRRPNLFRLIFPKHLYPKTLILSLTTKCNLDCMICERQNFHGAGEDLKFENLYKLKNAIKYAEAIDLTGMGEPYLYPKFDKVLEYVYSLNPNNNLIQITTNGTVLSAARARELNGRLRRCIISLNSPDPVSYRRYMNYDFSKTVARIAEFVSALDEDERGKVFLHFVAHSKNLDEIPDFVRLAGDLGIRNAGFYHFQIYRKEHIDYTLLNARAEYNAALDKAESVGRGIGVFVECRRFFEEQPKPVDPDNCETPFNETIIGINGGVAICCYCGSLTLGNAFETSFESVWFGEKYIKLRKKRYLDVCQSCVPILPFDDYRTHIHAQLKERDDYSEIVARYEGSSCDYGKPVAVR